MKGHRYLFWITAVTAVLVCGPEVFAGEEYSREEALRVVRSIDRVLQEQEKGPGRGIKKITLTESELNSYIAFRIEEERSDIMRELRLKIHPENKIEGKIYVDLRKQDLPKLLRPEMNFYFDGTLEVRSGFVRIKLHSLYLESQKIMPELLNLVIEVGSKIQNTEPFRLDDWFELPYGIKNIETGTGCAAFYY